MIRLGLCCIFKEEPIKFRITTAKRLLTFQREEQLELLGELCLHNARTLKTALQYCVENGIGDFRVMSQINPLRTHPEAGYQLQDLPNHPLIRQTYLECRQFNQINKIRSTFHPDQFIVLSTPHPQVLRSSLAELAYQAEIAELIGADVINIHAGGAYGDKKKSLNRLHNVLTGLPDLIRSRLTLENDDRNYSPADLLPFCHELGVPLVYDVHHHRVLKDSLSIESATELALKTWNREPLFHISSPRDGWDNPNPHFHHDYIDLRDFPNCWKYLDLTIEVEAKAKELAIKRLREQLWALHIAVR